MTLTEQVLTIAIAAGATMLTRFGAFLFFPSQKPIPPLIQKIGQFLPPAILSMLVVYCYKDILFTLDRTLVNNLVAGLVTAGCHLWRRNMFLSICVGTICYSLLLVF
ncbi:branched-chain amino acid transporter permease [Loigolactobacillus bifermentans]|jgi:branched-subunit amino acid transport protein AzlD|uniref:Branched-chain amino acid transport protein AzlD n=1 Tax=Loigolactobacillus bifermentans DSM 20003 TaxID=1423726 RepID=A0A0R1GGG9_9LACO|nr:AzlD domain-containing protein [Loigolactobacillus bifermentans]KRK33199.1 hypothetical protein FC07_GL001454 [Loigolactobacillus bifermentans DSM 20003]QGG60546.1 branched-chain amino acid transporter AzlD [Loigolactobacillus bifermentans]